MKRFLSVFLLITMLTTLMSTTAFAAKGDPLAAGFYGKVSAANVTVEMQDANGNKVSSVSAVSPEGGNVTYYPGTVRMKVTYTGEATKGDQFMVLLVKGDDLPTVSNAIYYIDQVAKGDDEPVVFEKVYPMEPAESMAMTLYITGNGENFETIKIPMGYAKSGYTDAGYTLGDVTGDGNVSALDASAVLQIVVGSGDWTETQRLAADADKNGRVSAYDASTILQKVVGLIDEF